MWFGPIKCSGITFHHSVPFILQSSSKLSFPHKTSTGFELILFSCPWKVLADALMQVFCREYSVKYHVCTLEPNSYSSSIIGIFKLDFCTKYYIILYYICTNHFTVHIYCVGLSVYFFIVFFETFLFCCYLSCSFEFDK